MESNDTYLAKSDLETHLSRISSHGLTQHQQLTEVIQLKNERLGALETITGGFERYLNQVPDDVPEKETWQNTFGEAKHFLQHFTRNV